MITAFTPWESLLGGVLIGLASVALMAFQGRIFGATGILAGFFAPESSGDWAWRGALLAGMMSAPALLFAVTGQMPAIEANMPLWLQIAGGVLVGIGVTFGSGCTSGHGVCGMARGSRRSIVATATFMVTTAVTVYVLRHMLGY